MKILIFFSLYIAGLSSLYSQEHDVNYFTSSEEAISYATEHDGKILMVFAGSDWCRPCMKFKQEVLEQAEFKTKTEDKLAVLYLDFPSKKKNKLSAEETAHNEALAREYNTSGTFPTIILMDKAMHKIREITYEGQSLDQFISIL
jgi:thioredoxin-related protein